MSPVAFKQVVLMSSVRCRAGGHRYRFQAQGATLRWWCQRGCGAGGEKSYASAAEARRYAAAFDAEDRDTLGRRAPIGLTPLRLLSLLRRRGGSSAR
jgi:hypothetical protein